MEKDHDMPYVVSVFNHPRNVSRVSHKILIPHSMCGAKLHYRTQHPEYCSEMYPASNQQ